MSTIEDNYTKTVEFLSKSLSIFKTHVDYTQKFALEFKELFEIGENLQTEYKVLVASKTPAKIDSTKTTQSLKKIKSAKKQLKQTIIDEPVENLHTLWNPVIINDNINGTFNEMDQFLNEVKMEQHEPNVTDEAWDNAVASNENSFNENDDQLFDEVQPQTSGFDKTDPEDSSYVEDLFSLMEDESIDQTQVDDSLFTENDTTSDLPGQNKKKGPKERKHRCEICAKGFHQALHLAKHMRVHTRERLFGCEICSKRFSQPGNLVKHMRLHSGEKTFDCEQCSKRFADSFSLNQHTRVHTGEKPFSCEICSNRFSQSGSLARHMKLHEKNDLIKSQVKNEKPQGVS